MITIYLLTVFILPLHKAIERGDQSVMKCWLQNGNTKVNECRGGRANHRHFVVADGTALHWAVYYGQLDIAQQLLKQDAGICISISGSKNKILIHDNYVHCAAQTV